MVDSWPIRPAVSADAAAIAAAEQLCFNDPWSAAGIAELFQDETIIGRLVASEGPEMRLAGYAFGRVIAGEAEILSLAVLPRYRRRGQGRRLLDAALVEARARGAREVFLEVRESNESARALYVGRGFRAVGLRPDYYRKPRENGLLLRLDLSVAVI